MLKQLPSEFRFRRALLVARVLVVVWRENQEEQRIDFAHRRRTRAMKIRNAGVVGLLLLGAGGGGLSVCAEEIGEFGRPNSNEEKVSSHDADEATPKPKSALVSDLNRNSPPVPPGISNDGKTPVVAPVLPDRAANDESSEKKNGDFLWWCQHLMGIKMPHVEIRTFDYPDYLEERAAWDAYHAELATVRAVQSVLGNDDSISSTSSRA